MLRNYSYYTSPGRILQSGFYRGNLPDPSPPRRAGGGVVPGRMEDTPWYSARTTKKQAAHLILNCTPFVRQYGILSNKWGVLLCQKEYQTNDIRRNSRKLVIETMQEEKLSYSETCQ